MENRTTCPLGLGQTIECLAVTDKEFVLVDFIALHANGGIGIRIRFLARAGALVRVRTAFVLASVDVGPYRPGIDAR